MNIADMSAAGSARSSLPAGLVQQGLKEALIETLTAILSPVQEVRAAAEEQIKVLEVTEGEWRPAGLQVDGGTGPGCSPLSLRPPVKPRTTRTDTADFPQ